MFEQTFKNIDDALWKESGCTTELDYTEQTSWLLFLKYLDSLEQDKATEAALEGKPYTHILPAAYRWDTWAAPKDAQGKLDHNRAMTGDDLVQFVDTQLFPHLHAIKQRASGPHTIEYKIGEIFGEIKHKIRSGYTLRDIIDHVDELRFRSQTEKQDNLLAEHHIRYGKTGGIAYRHVADNYIALFSRFIACGTFEATHILDALLQNLSDVQPSRVHADTHGQSAAVFGLAYLLGIELMPRIRRWHALNLYRPDSGNKYSRINSLFSGTVNWALIHEHYPQFMQLALAIQSGTLAPSAVLARVNSYSTKNRFAMALRELGQAVRTTYLLEWVMDESLRRTVHKGTTKVERHHKFAKHLAFGAGGHLRSNNPADQEKAIVYNELVTNAVALQNVVDQTQALHAMKSKGINVRAADLAFLSPYATSNLKRFGDYPTDLQPESMPTCTTLPL